MNVLGWFFLVVVGGLLVALLGAVAVPMRPPLRRIERAGYRMLPGGVLRLTCDVGSDRRTFERSGGLWRDLDSGELVRGELADELDTLAGGGSEA